MKFLKASQLRLLPATIPGEKEISVIPNESTIEKHQVHAHHIGLFLGAVHGSVVFQDTFGKDRDLLR